MSAKKMLPQDVRGASPVNERFYSWGVEYVIALWSTHENISSSNASDDELDNIGSRPIIYAVQEPETIGS
jgi:hypothetical protein